MLDYQSLASDTLALLKEAGVQVQVLRKVPGVVDPVSERTVIPGADQEFSVSAVLDNPTDRSNSYITKRLETLFRGGDQILLVGAGPYEPQPLDKMTLPSGEVYRVIETDPVRPGGVVVLHVVLARK